jgi:hypothetical protein
MSPMSTIRCAQSHFHPHGTFGENCTPVLRLHQNYLQMDRNEFLLDPRHLGAQSGAAKMISEPVVRSAQTVHLSCTETNTISKQTETSFHLTYITCVYHQVCPNHFHARGTFGANRAHVFPENKTISKRIKMSFHLIHVT